MDTNDDATIPEFKKRKRNVNIRMSQAASEVEDSSTAVKIIKRPQQTSALSASTKRDQITKEEDDGHQFLKNFDVNYYSQQDIERDKGAKTSEIDTAYEADAKALFERQELLNKEIQGKADDKLYRGQLGYVKYFKKQDSLKGKASSNLVRQGPFRAANNIRVTTRWDYQQDLCKDYKDTGFCGFGDSCKFVHDRTDYKAGWEIERDYKINQLKEITDEYEISDDENKNISRPTVCPICNNNFTIPVKTKCNHYFCEKCALDHFKTVKSCFVCDAPTDMVFTYEKGPIIPDFASIVNEIKDQEDTGSSQSSHETSLSSAE